MRKAKRRPEPDEGLIFVTELEKRCSAILKEVAPWIWEKKVRLLVEFVKAEIAHASDDQD